MMFLYVLFGAVGKHLLEGQGFQNLDTFETGLKYHGIHGLVLLTVCLLKEMNLILRFNLIYWMFFIGVILFSFSLYAYVLTGASVFAMITPFGGMTWLATWLLLCWDLKKGP